METANKIEKVAAIVVLSTVTVATVTATVVGVTQTANDKNTNDVVVTKVDQSEEQTRDPSDWSESEMLTNLKSSTPVIQNLSDEQTSILLDNTCSQYDSMLQANFSLNDTVARIYNGYLDGGFTRDEATNVMLYSTYFRCPDVYKVTEGILLGE